MADDISTPTVSEILKEEFMEPMNLSAYRLAKEIHVPVSRIQAILNGSRKITADTSLRLARFFGVSDGQIFSGSSERSGYSGAESKHEGRNIKDPALSSVSIPAHIEPRVR